MTDIEGWRDQEADPVVSAKVYGGPEDMYRRIEETYHSVPFSDMELVRRVTYPRLDSLDGSRVEFFTYVG